MPGSALDGETIHWIVSCSVSIFNRCGVWLRSCTVERCFHLQMVCPVVPNRSAKADAGSVLPWIAARTFGVVVAWL